jgi:hypothetical protein
LACWTGPEDSSFCASARSWLSRSPARCAAARSLAATAGATAQARAPTSEQRPGIPGIAHEVEAVDRGRHHVLRVSLPAFGEAQLGLELNQRQVVLAALAAYMPGPAERRPRGGGQCLSVDQVAAAQRDLTGEVPQPDAIELRRRKAPGHAR